jgi:hypothetical protein
MSIKNRVYFDLVELGLEEYGENDFVFDTIAEAQKIFSSSENCTCYRRSNTKNFHPCFEIIGFKPFFERLIHLKGLDKKEKDLFIKTQLMIGDLSDNKDNNSEVQKIRYKYAFNGSIKICQSIFMELCGIKKQILENLQDHYKKYGLDERIHRNTGRASSLECRVKITNEISISVKNFLNNYALNFGLPSPMRSRKDSDVFIYLPTETTYTSVYEEYKKYYIEEIDNNVISRVSFCRLWKQLMPHFKFQPLATDMCDTCTDFKAQLKSKANENNCEEIQRRYTDHQQLAKLERDHYTKNIMKSVNFNPGACAGGTASKHRRAHRHAEELIGSEGESGGGLRCEDLPVRTERRRARRHGQGNCGKDRRDTHPALQPSRHHRRARDRRSGIAGGSS